MTDDVRLIIEDDMEGAATVVAKLLAEAAAAEQQIALTGGRTPGRAYELAAQMQPGWDGAGVWWGDERCVPPDDERSNYGLAKRALLDRLATQPAVHRIRGELLPDEAAREYEDELRGVRLDLLLLGIGPDGHTASLFPNEPTLGELERLVVPAEAKHEPYVERITLTLPALTAAARVVFLATGEEKADAVGRAFGEPPSRATPASLVRSASGDTTAVLDRAAAAHLRR